MLNLAGLDAPLDQLRPGGVDVRDDHLHALHGPRLRVHESFADSDRASRPGRRQLDEANLRVDDLVVVRVEADLLGIKGLCAVYVGDGDRYEFELPVHVTSSLRHGRPMYRSQKITEDSQGKIRPLSTYRPVDPTTTSHQRVTS